MERERDGEREGRREGEREREGRRERKEGRERESNNRNSKTTYTNDETQVSSISSQFIYQTTFTFTAAEYA